MKKNSAIRQRILNELRKQPQTVSQLMEKLTEISSLGTLAYHLRELKKERLVDSKKEDNQRGRPTLYFLRTPNGGKMTTLEILETHEKNKEKIHLKILKDLAIKEISVQKLFSKYSKDHEDDVNEAIHDGENIEIVARITPEGKRFLKENSK